MRRKYLSFKTYISSLCPTMNESSIVGYGILLLLYCYNNLCYYVIKRETYEEKINVSVLTLIFILLSSFWRLKSSQSFKTVVYPDSDQIFVQGRFSGGRGAIGRSLLEPLF